jgi:hypothetical protein
MLAAVLLENNVEAVKCEKTSHCIKGATCYFGRNGENRGSCRKWPGTYGSRYADTCHTNSDCRGILICSEKWSRHENVCVERTHSNGGWPTRTDTGKKCVVPFKYKFGGEEINTCTSVGTSKGVWCATSVKNDLTYDDWDWCE